MKSIATIFAFFVLFLTVQPALAMVGQEDERECCGGACSSTEEEPKNPTDDSCCDSNCNPFLSCCCSTGYIVNTSTFSLIPLPILAITTPFMDGLTNSEFVKACWQPPTLS